MMHLKLFVASVFAGFFCTWLMRVVALRFEIVNQPNPIIRDHRVPVPYLGGVGVLLGALISICLFRGADAIGWIVLCGFVAFGLLGLLDDLASLSPQVKFVAQILVTLALLAISYFGNDHGVHWELAGRSWLNIALAAFWLVTMVNAMNFVDVCDGLAASIGAATLLCWGWFALAHLRVIYLAVGGACIGFLWWNKPPARIYLGDCGSQALGFLIGAAALEGWMRLPNRGVGIASPLLWNGVPLFELIFITAVRIRKGLRWWKGSPDHFALRLQRAGLSKSAIDVIAAGTTLVLWLCGLALPRMSPVSASLLIAILLTGLVVCWRLLLLWEA
jgi:UDP-GlcNAc:undecaprenyl-phosphate/decaprenyl-phosphate GlcNAc-1-phosphate transferase